MDNILTTNLSKYYEEFARFELERFYALVSLVAHLEFGKGREIWSIVQHIHHVYTHCCVYTRAQEVKFRATAELNAAIELLTLLTMSGHKSGYGYCTRVWYRSFLYNSSVPTNSFEHNHTWYCCS